jgi:hypothetical protein
VSIWTKVPYTYPLDPGYWDALVQGTEDSEYFSTLEIISSPPYDQASVRVSLHHVEPATGDMTLTGQGTGNLEVGAEPVSSYFFNPHITYVNGRWIGLWPYFNTASDDAGRYWVGVWRESGGDVVFDVNESVVVPYAHSLGSLSYGWVLATLDDCVIINTAYVVGADRRVYTRVIPVGPGSSASAVTADFSVVPQEIAYPATWVPVSSSSVRVYYVTNGLSPHSYVVGKDGSVTPDSPAVVDGWWFSTGFTAYYANRVDGDILRWVRNGSTAYFYRIDQNGTVVNSVQTYTGGGFGSNTSLGQYTIVGFAGKYWAADWATLSVSEMVTEDIFGESIDFFYGGSVFPSPPVGGIGRLNIVRTKSRLIAVGTASADFHYWVSSATEITPGLRLYQRDDTAGVGKAPRITDALYQSLGNDPMSQQGNPARLPQGGNVYL